MLRNVCSHTLLLLWARSMPDGIIIFPERLSKKGWSLMVQGLDSLGFEYMLDALARGGAWVTGACIVLSLVLAIIIYVLLVPHEHSGEHKGARGFFNFDTLIIAPVFKFLYILAASALIVFGVAIIVTGIVEAIRYDYPDYAMASLVALLAIVVGEFVLRLAWELVFLSIKLVSDASAIKGMLARIASRELQGSANNAGQPFQSNTAYRGPSAPDGFTVNGTMPYDEPAWGNTTEQPTAQQPWAPQHLGSVQPTAVMTDIDVGQVPTWDCPSCGQKGNTGGFCARCGLPRPISRT